MYVNEAVLMQGFYVSMVYHGFSIQYGGDVSVLDEAAWLAGWVLLLKLVLESDVCKVSISALGGMRPFVHSHVAV